MKAGVAKYSDMNAMVQLCRRQHEQSSWNDLDFNAARVRKNLVRLIRSPNMDALVVRDESGTIQGLLLATVDQFFMSNTIYASDVHFACESGGVQLLAEFKRWAYAHNAKYMIMGIGNDDPDTKVSRFYKAVGMHQRGDAWVLPLDQSQEKVA